MKKILNKYKKAFLILGILVTCLLIWIIIVVKQEPSSPPVSTREPPEETPIVKIDPLKIEKASPPSGTTVTTLADTIVIYFNEEIDISTLKYSINPEISLATETYKNKKELHILPDKVWWEEGKTYTIRITSLKGINGEVLKEPFIYEYTRSPAENIPLGDPPPEKTGNEF